MKAELIDLRIDLAQEEQEAQARKREADLLQQRIRKRLETIEAYQAQVADKKARLADEKKEEELFREKVFLPPLELIAKSILVDAKVCRR